MTRRRLWFPVALILAGWVLASHVAAAPEATPAVAATPVAEPVFVARLFRSVDGASTVYFIAANYGTVDAIEAVFADLRRDSDLGTPEAMVRAGFPSLGDERLVFYEDYGPDEQQLIVTVRVGAIRLSLAVIGPDALSLAEDLVPLIPVDEAATAGDRVGRELFAILPIADDLPPGFVLDEEIVEGEAATPNP